MIDQTTDLTTEPSLPSSPSKAKQIEITTQMKNLQNSKPVTLDAVFEYLHTSLNGFADDPADSDFQEGYERALTEMLYYILGVRNTADRAFALSLVLEDHDNALGLDGVRRELHPSQN